MMSSFFKINEETLELERTTYIHVCTYAFMYVRMYVCIYVRMYVCVYVYMYVCTYVRVCGCVCVYEVKILFAIWIRMSEDNIKMAIKTV